MNKTENITFRLSKEDKRKLSALAEREQRTISNYLSVIIRKQLKASSKKRRRD